MLTLREPNTDDFYADVENYFTSLEWLYVTNRYSVENQKMLLRLLTLAGLDVYGWRRCTMPFINAAYQGRITLTRKDHLQDQEEQRWLKQAISEIWAYAASQDIATGEPPLCPAYLMVYGYTQEDYLADLENLYGRAFTQRYAGPWPLALSPRLQPPCTGFLRQSVAVMGATAGAIERLVEIGAGYGHDNS